MKKIINKIGKLYLSFKNKIFKNKKEETKTDINENEALLERLSKLKKEIETEQNKRQNKKKNEKFHRIIEEKGTFDPFVVEDVLIKPVLHKEENGEYAEFKTPGDLINQIRLEKLEKITKLYDKIKNIKKQNKTQYQRDFDFFDKELCMLKIPKNIIKKEKSNISEDKTEEERDPRAEYYNRLALEYIDPRAIYYKYLAREKENSERIDSKNIIKEVKSIKKLGSNDKINIFGKFILKNEYGSLFEINRDKSQNNGKIIMFPIPENENFKEQLKEINQINKVIAKFKQKRKEKLVKKGKNIFKKLNIYKIN